MDEQEIAKTEIQLTDAIQTDAPKMADNIAITQLSIYYSQLDSDGLPKNFVEIYLSCTGKDAQPSKRIVTLSGEDADWFVNAVSDLAVAAVMSKLGISEGLRK